MEIKVLGSYGSQLPGNNFSSFLINQSVVLEAGSITSTLTLSQQKKIKYILVTHSHLDHVKDVAFLADNLRPSTTSVELISSQEVLDIIKTHLLNNVLWPDFTQIPNPTSPILKYRPLALNTETEINGLQIKMISVNHLVPTVAYFITEKEETVLFSGDMGPSRELWEAANQIKNLKAVFVDVSFPNLLQETADKSKHLTPQTLAQELTKLKKTVPVYAYHLKSRFQKEIEDDLSQDCPEVKTLKAGKVLSFHE